MNGRQYITVKSNGVVMCSNILIQTGMPLVNAGYLGFSGEMIVVDTVSNEPPSYSGWNSRWILMYAY